MTAPLFDPDKCNVGSIASLAFDFVSDCSVDAAPQPIFDCPLPIVPREPPPPICPEFGGSARVSYYNADCPAEASDAATAFTVTRIDSDPCRFFIDLDLSIPRPVVPCPNIQGGAVTVTTGYADCVGAAGGALTVTATQTEVDPCDSNSSQNAAVCRFTIDLDLTVPVPRPPCPVIDGGEVTVTTGYRDCVGPARGSIRVNTIERVDDCGSDSTNSAQCQFTIDLDLTVPIPRPQCPIIEAGSVSVTAGYSTCPNPTANFLTITPVTRYRECSDGIDNSSSSEAFCQYVIDLDISVPIPPPPCPEITITGAIEYVTGAAAPTIAAQVVSTETQGDCGSLPLCAFDISLDIGIPKPPCPDITGAVTVFYAEDGPTGWIDVVPTEGASGLCEFDLDINIGLPFARPCPSITGDVSVFYSASPTGWIAVSPTENASGVCTFDLDINVGVPTGRPCPTITGGVTTYFANQPTGYLLTTRTENASGLCSFDLDFFIGFPQIRPCPAITGEITTYQADEATGYLIVTPTENASGLCSFDLDFFIGFPRMRPCPTITGDVNVYEASQPTGYLTVVPYVPLDPSLPCTYDLEVFVGYRRTTFAKGTVTCAYTVCDVNPTCDVTVHPPNAAGVQLLDIDIRIPRPPTYTGALLELRDAANNLYGSGLLNVGQTGCTRTVGGTVTLNVTNCGAEGGGGGGGYVPGVGP